MELLEPRVPQLGRRVVAFPQDPERIVQKDLEIQQDIDRDNDLMIPHALVLKPGARHLQHLQRLLVLGTPLVRRPVARPAGCHSGGPSRLGSEHPRTARGLERRRPLAVPRVEHGLRQVRRRGPDRR